MAGLRSSRPKVISPEVETGADNRLLLEIRVMWLVESKFYHAQQYPSIPITICGACFF